MIWNLKRQSQYAVYVNSRMKDMVTMRNHSKSVDAATAATKNL